jgi:hypothetical protein
VEAETLLSEFQSYLDNGMPRYGVVNAFVNHADEPKIVMSFADVAAIKLVAHEHIRNG